MNWLVLGVALLVLGPVLIWLGYRKPRERLDPPELVQYGFLSIIIGVFVLLVQQSTITIAMLVFVVITGAMWCAAKLMRRGAHKERRLPDWLEYGSGFFVVILVVFVLRSFLAEPFQIPSSSMRPGLIVGDFILVNKYAYGIRMPVTNKVVIKVGSPQHGDVMVFNYPEDPKQNYIKRVIGLPGDTVIYRNKRLTINGQAVPAREVGVYSYEDAARDGTKDSFQTVQLEEKQGQHTYFTLNMPEYPAIAPMAGQDQFKYRENCHYDSEGFECIVPKGYYFMLGDNRDNSKDSRYWGFVPEEYVVGKAVLVWMNFGDLRRIGNLVH